MGCHLSWILLNEVLTQATQESRTPTQHTHTHIQQTEVTPPHHHHQALMFSSNKTSDARAATTTSIWHLVDPSPPRGLKWTPALHHMPVNQRGSSITTIWIPHWHWASRKSLTSTEEHHCNCCSQSWDPRHSERPIWIWIWIVWNKLLLSYSVFTVTIICGGGGLCLCHKNEVHKLRHKHSSCQVIRLEGWVSSPIFPSQNAHNPLLGHPD